METSDWRDPPKRNAKKKRKRKRKQTKEKKKTKTIQNVVQTRRHRLAGPIDWPPNRLRLGRSLAVPFGPRRSSSAQASAGQSRGHTRETAPDWLSMTSLSRRPRLARYVIGSRRTSVAERNESVRGKRTQFSEI